MNHHAKVEKSDRLQAALAVLKKGGWRSALELAQAAQTLAIGSTMSELRTNGYKIEQRYSGKTLRGRTISEYRLSPSVIGEQVSMFTVGFDGRAK